MAAAPRRAARALVLGLVAAAAGCAWPRGPVDTLPPAARAAFRACRARLLRRLCPPPAPEGCAGAVTAAYLRVPPARRTRWLAARGCPEAARKARPAGVAGMMVAPPEPRPGPSAAPAEGP